MIQLIALVSVLSVWFMAVVDAAPPQKPTAQQRQSQPKGKNAAATKGKNAAVTKGKNTAAAKGKEAANRKRQAAIEKKRKEAERKQQPKVADFKGEAAPKNNKLALRNAGDLPNVDLKIAPVDPWAKNSVLASAALIDQFVEAKLAAEGITPNPPSTDEQFVRRIYLDIIGTVPRGRQSFSFLSTTQPGKRSILIDHLLNQPGYASHMFNMWADVFRVRDKTANVVYLRPFGDWLKQSFRENRPWDEMVHEMFTAEGKSWESPAVGYKLRDRGMPLDNLSNSVRIFLGTRIGCAQCHDHPFDRWTQKEFYQLAAYEGGVQTRMLRKGPMSFDLPAIAEAREKVTGRKTNQLNRIKGLNVTQVFEDHRRRLKYPHDYAYEDAKPEEFVVPNVIFGKKPEVYEGDSKRKAFADWLTSKDNPRFALTIANRMWKRAMGVGLIEPVDDMTDDTTASNPELMDFLVSEMMRLDFNLKEFMRIIYHTRTYQRQVTYDGYDPTEHYHFPGPVLRRMTAEQVWDSLITLSIKSPDSFLRPSDSKLRAAMNAQPGTSANQLISKIEQMSIAQKSMSMEDGKLRYENVLLRRASELPQPLPADHFLRQFGQSDRELIESGTTEGTVPQLLALFNGPVTHMMLEAGSVIHSEVTWAEGIENQTKIVFLSVLGRLPDADELAIATAEIRQSGSAGYGNVIWSLLNTREFLFIQ